MAFLFTDQAFLNRVFMPQVVDAISRSNPVLQAIPKQPKTTTVCRWDVKTGSTSTVSGISDGDSYVVGANGATYVGASLPWAKYYTTVEIGKTTVDQLSADQPNEFLSLVQTRLSDAAADLADKIALDLFSAGNSTGFVGLPDALNDSNVYGGIDRSLAANANFRTPTVDAAGVPISTNLLTSLDTAYFAANKRALYGVGSPMLLFTSAAIHERYSRLFTQIDLSTLAAAHFVNQMNATGSLGEAQLAYRGTPLIRTAEYSTPTGDTASTNRIYAVDMSRVRIYTLPHNPAIIQGDRVVGTDRYLDLPNGGINARLEILPNSAEAYRIAIVATLQLAVENPKAAGAVLRNILL